MLGAPRRVAARVTPAVVLAVSLLTLAGCGGSEEVDFSATPVDPPFQVSGEPLRTTDGESVSLAEVAESEGRRLTLVFFGYTRCPDICPAVLASLTAGLRALDPSERRQVDVVFVSTDPARDTDRDIERYLARFDPDYTGATGPVERLARVGRSIGIFVDRGEELPGGGYDPNSHGTYVIGVDRFGEAPVIWDAETTPSQFSDDISFMLDESA